MAAAVLAISAPIALLAPTPAQARPSASELQAQIDAKSQDLAGVIEKYNQLNVTLQRTQAQATTVAAKVEPLAARVKAANHTVDLLATRAYEGSAVSRVSALLSAGSPDALIDRLNALGMVARGQQRDIDQLTTANKALLDQQAQLNALVSAQTAQQTTLASQKSSIETQLADLKRQRDALPHSSSSGGGGSSTTPPPYVAGRAAKVVAYAYAQLGKPYVFGAAGPNSFDCSGLTMKAWAQVGVHLDHASYVQMNEQTVHISRSQLQPGDLVFFYGGGHVGIYVGNNSVIHAPKPGDVVKESTIDWMGGYTVSGRPR